MHSVAPRPKDVALLVCLQALKKLYPAVFASSKPLGLRPVVYFPDQESLACVRRRVIHWALASVGTFHEKCDADDEAKTGAKTETERPKRKERGSALASSIAKKLSSRRDLNDDRSTATKKKQMSSLNDLDALVPVFELLNLVSHGDEHSAASSGVFADALLKQIIDILSASSNVATAGEVVTSARIVSPSFASASSPSRTRSHANMPSVFTMEVLTDREPHQLPYDVVTRYFLLMRSLWECSDLQRQSKIADCMGAWHTFLSNVPGLRVFNINWSQTKMGSMPTVSPIASGMPLNSLTASKDLPIVKAAIHAAFATHETIPLEEFDPFIATPQSTTDGSSGQQGSHPIPGGTTMTIQQRTSMAMLSYASLYLQLNIPSAALACADVAIVNAHQSHNASLESIVTAAHAVRYGCHCAQGDPAAASDDLAIGFHSTQQRVNPTSGTRDVLMLAIATHLVHYPGTVTEGLRRVVLAASDHRDQQQQQQGGGQSSNNSATASAVELVHSLKQSVVVALRCSLHLSVMAQNPYKGFSTRLLRAAVACDASRWLGIPFFWDDSLLEVPVMLMKPFTTSVEDATGSTKDETRQVLPPGPDATAYEGLIIAEALRRMEVFGNPKSALTLLAHGRKVLHPDSHSSDYAFAVKIVTADALLHAGYALYAVELLQPCVEGWMDGLVATRSPYSMAMLVDAVSVLSQALVLVGRVSEVDRVATFLEGVSNESSFVHGVIASKLWLAQVELLNGAAAASSASLKELFKYVEPLELPIAAKALLQQASIAMLRKDMKMATECLEKVEASDCTAAQLRQKHLLACRMTPKGADPLQGLWLRHPIDEDEDDDYCSSGGGGNASPSVACSLAEEVAIRNLAANINNAVVDLKQSALDTMQLLKHRCCHVSTATLTPVDGFNVTRMCSIDQHLLQATQLLVAEEKRRSK